MKDWMLRLRQFVIARCKTPNQPPHNLTEQRRQLGRRSEALAVQFLQARGYTIQATNVRYPVGEIDIVAQDGHVLCFVEVRSTRSMQWGGPLETITGRKRSRMLRAARWYLQRYRTLPEEVRFDVVGVVWADAAEPSVELVKGALLDET